MIKGLLLFPFGGNAREAVLSIFAINRMRKEWVVLGFIDDDHSLHGKEYYGIKVLGGRESLKEYADTFVLALPGSPKSYLRRKDIIESLNIETSRFATIIHPSVVTAPDSKVGYNTVIMPNVVISCAAEVGNHCIILPNTVIAHDSIVRDYCCIGSNVSVSGHVTISSGCYIGSGARMRENVCIGEQSLIGLGANVISDIESRVVAVGNPAKVIRKSTS
jgi:sugar O-acyltransferase (sialic acid O-acetyltransferase NeuD family)